MIRINLLPVPKARKIKKQAEIRSQVILAGLVLVMIAIICSYVWFDLNKTTKRLEVAKATATNELNLLKEKVKEVENYERNKKALEDKNKIIEQLRKNQSVPVHILDEISLGLEPLKLWLISLSVQEDRVSLDGKAVSNSGIVEFINRLKASRYFSDVSLIESRQIKEGGISVYQFKLQSTIAL